MWLAWAIPALAGSVYVNGINVDALRGQTFDDVTVMVDGKGDVWIYAPAYEIQLVDPRTGLPIQPKQGPVPATPAPAAAAPVAAPAPAAAAAAPVAPVAPVALVAGAVAPLALPAAPAPRPPVLAPPPVVAPSAPRWWLVTEDNGSSGHTIEVVVNGTLAHTVRSGGGQQILDISDRLHPGVNTVRMQSSSTSPTGGAFYAYIGRGSNDSGTVVLEKPEIQYGLGTSRQGPYGRDYELIVP